MIIGVMVSELVFILLIVVVFLWFFVYKHNKEQKDITNFLNELDKQTLIKLDSLETILEDECQIEPHVVNKTIKDIRASEHSVVTKLKETAYKTGMIPLNIIDRQLTNLSKPYLKLIRYITKSNRIDDAKFCIVDKQLTERLNEASDLIDEITKEYDRLFEANGTTDTLLHSKERVLQILRQTHNKG